MISSAVMILNGKGGVLKTSLAANVAGLAAADGWKVLAVDLDAQGNLARDLGYMDRSDGGAAMLRAVRDGTEVEVVSEVRPRLDVVAGGPATAELSDWLTSRAAGGDLSAYRGVERALEGVSRSYDIVVIDCPPGYALLHAAAMTAAHYVVVPTQPDQASIDGLGAVFSRWLEVRGTTNPDITILGVLLAPVPVNASALRREVRAQLDELLGADVVVLDGTIRLAQRPAMECRKYGLLAHELSEAATENTPWWQLRRSGGEGAGKMRVSETAHGLASDYRGVVTEILVSFSAQQTEWVARAGRR